MRFVARTTVAPGRRNIGLPYKKCNCSPKIIREFPGCLFRGCFSIYCGRASVPSSIINTFISGYMRMRSMRILYAFSRRAHSIQMVIIAGSTRAVCWSLPTETSASANNGHRRMVMLELSRRAIIGIDYPSDGIAAACGRIARKSNVRLVL